MESAPKRYHVAGHADHVEVTGANEDDVREALELLFQWRSTQNEAVAVITDSLTVALAQVRPVVSPERSMAAQRRAAHRASLLETHTFSYASLAEMRGLAGESAARSWMTRNRRKVIAVKVNGRTAIPSFQFTDAGELRGEVAEVNEILARDQDFSEWTRWTWWTAPTSWLSGAVPLELIEDDRARVKRAAQNFVARTAA